MKLTGWRLREEDAQGDSRGVGVCMLHKYSRYLDLIDRYSLINQTRQTAQSWEMT